MNLSRRSELLVMICALFIIGNAAAQPKELAVPAPAEPLQVSAEQIEKLISQLGDDEFKKRSDAKKQLEAIGDAALEALRKVIQTTDDPEIRSSAKATIKSIEENFHLVRVFKRHQSRVNGVAMSGDGKHALSAGWDGFLYYWDLETGKLIGSLQGHTTFIMSVAMSADGNYALSSSGDFTMRLWDLKTLKEVRAYKHPANVNDVAFSPDGTQALSGCGDGIARLWNLETDKEVFALPTLTNCRNWTVAFTPDGKQAITGGGNLFDPKGKEATALKLWDLTTGKMVLEYQGHTRDVRSVAVSADGKQLLSGSFDGTMRLWDLKSGAELKRFEGPGSFVETVRFMPDNQRVICCYGPKSKAATYEGDPSCSLRLWNISTGKEIMQFKGHSAPILCLAFNGDGSLLVSGSADNTMRLWRVPK